MTLSPCCYQGLGQEVQTQDRFEVRKQNKKECCLRLFSSSHTRKRRFLGVADLARYLLLQKLWFCPYSFLFRLSIDPSAEAMVASFSIRSLGMRTGTLSETHLNLMMVAEAVLSFLISFKNQTNRKPDQFLMFISKCKI